MLILGRNEGTTLSGKKLKDGAVCLMDETGVRFALAEERVTREKQASGYAGALGRMESQTGVSHRDLDYVAVSSCCEPIREGIPTQGRARYVVVNHHISHAYSAFCVSPLDQALVVVIDAGGNVLAPGMRSGDWWRYQREQHSYFLGRGNSLRLIGRDCAEAHDMGLGEFYRAVTHFLGWPSSEYCGNVMALAGLGEVPRGWPRAFEVSESIGIHPLMRNEPLRAAEVVREFLHQHGVRVEPRGRGESVQPEHAMVARWAQGEVERVLFARLRAMMNEHKVFDLCLSGGFALNCSVNGKLWDNTPVRRVFIPIAPGDSGQALGNALYVRHYILARRERIQLKAPALGGDYDTSEERLQRLVAAGRRELMVWRGAKALQAVARLLTEGKVVGLFCDRSEFGPRALGFRSILGDPRSLRARDRLNTGIKKRESFMPYAPSVLREDSDAWFECRGECAYMQFAFRCRAGRAAEIPAVVHTDGTARLQAVSSEESPALHHILTEYRAITGIPILLNTSMNRRGEPIVETPEEAIELFDLTDIDAVAFGGNVVVCRPGISLSSSLGLSSASRVELTACKKTGMLVRRGTLIEDLRAIVREEFPDLGIFVRERFGMLPQYAEWLREGKKETTIRYRAGMVDLPIAWRLPMFVSGPGSDATVKTAHAVDIREVVLKRYSDVSEEDARTDGFASLDALTEALRGFYGHIARTALVSIYRIDAVA